MVDPELQCTAKSKQTGERRKRDVTPGKRVCYYHGGASTGPKTAKGKARVALNNLKHGIFANRILDEEERETFDAIVARIQSDFSLNDSSDTIAVEALAMACLRLSRAIKADDADAAERWDRIVRSHMKDLKATKIVREGEGKPLGTSPADWATSLLEELRSVNKAARRRQKRAEKAKGDATDGD